MKNILRHSIDWVSIKLNAICLIGLIGTSNIVVIFTILATITTVIYNCIKIYQELKIIKKK